jgi:hypothetical protein
MVIFQSQRWYKLTLLTSNVKIDKKYEKTKLNNIDLAQLAETISRKNLQ